MRKITLPVSSMLITLLAVACSTTMKTVPTEVTLDPSVAKTQASALTTIVTSASAEDGVGLAETLGSAANAAAALVPQGREASRSQVARRAVTTCACPKGSASCKFEGCTVGTAVVTGTLAWGDGKITCTKLTFNVPASSSVVGAANITVDCAFTYASGQLAGTLHTVGDAEVQGVDYDWDATLHVNELRFTTSALTGGSVDVSAKVTGTSEDGTQAYAGSAVVTLP